MTTSPQEALCLTVSIVLYESPLAELRCTLQSLREAASSAMAASVLREVRVYLVDHHVPGDYREQARGVMEEVEACEGLALHFIPQPDNPGYGAGHNRALAEADSDLHLVLNPDVELDPDALVEGVTALLANSGAALACPEGRSPDGAPAYLCKRYPTLWVLLLRGFAPGPLQRLFAKSLASYQYQDICAAAQPAPVEIASGCCMLWRTATLRELGGFDEDYFLYFEDFDLSLRLTNQGLGYALYCPGMRIVHHGGHTARKGGAHRRLFFSSAWRFFRRHGWQLV